MRHVATERACLGHDIILQNQDSIASETRRSCSRPALKLLAKCKKGMSSPKRSCCLPRRKKLQWKPCVKLPGLVEAYCRKLSHESLPPSLPSQFTRIPLCLISPASTEDSRDIHLLFARTPSFILRLLTRIRHRQLTTYKELAQVTCRAVDM